MEVPRHTMFSAVPRYLPATRGYGEKGGMRQSWVILRRLAGCGGVVAITAFVFCLDAYIQSPPSSDPRFWEGGWHGRIARAPILLISLLNDVEV